MCPTRISHDTLFCAARRYARTTSVSGRKASHTLVHALNDKLDRPDVFDRFVTTFKQRVASLRSESHSGPDDAGVQECERRIANLTEALAKVGWSNRSATNSVKRRLSWPA